jgi:hypothetical protein
MAASVPGVAPLALVHWRINGPEATLLGGATSLAPTRSHLLDRCNERAFAHGSVEGRVTDAARAGRGCVDLGESTRSMVEVEEARR